MAVVPDHWIQPVTYTPHTVDKSNLKSANYVNAQVMNSLFTKLTRMVVSLQQAATAQSARLTLYANWQVLYGNILKQVPTFTPGGTYLLNTTGVGQANTANSSFITVIQANQQLVANLAKSLQSNVNQTNDQSNSQSSLATAILQQLSTMLSSIFK